MPTTTLPMRTFAVQIATPLTDKVQVHDTKKIVASYYKTESGFTTFKDDQNQAVYTVRDDCLLSVERTPDNAPQANSN